MPVHRPRSLRRPLCVSLSRFGSSLAVCAAITLAGGSSAMAQERWQGNAPQGVPGDGFLWTNPANWLGDLLPSASADLEFGSGTPTTIILNGPQSANSISFTDGGFTLGAFGTQTLLTNLSGSLLVNPGQLATINASYAGTFGMYIDGGGTIFLNNPQPLFTGDITVDNGSTLMANLGGITPQVNGTASVQNVGRQDALPLGLTPGVRTVTLQNNGEFKLIGSGANPDGATKNLVLGSGGGVINTAAGYIQFNLDDGSQISGTGDLVKKGAGRLTLTSQDYLLSGNLVINAGIVDFGRLNAGGGGGTRFSSFSAESTFTINGGIVVPNSGTQGRIDNKITLNDTGAIGVQGTDHIYGNDAAGPVVGWTLNGGTILLRDAFNVQQARLPRIRTLMSGSGIVDVVGATGNAANSRLVLERGDLAHDFSGTFVVKDLANVESNPRNGIDGTARSGKAFGNATIDLRGFGALLDVRDAANNTSNILLNSGASDYSTNHIVVSGVEPGGRQTVSISNGGATGAGTGNVMPFASLTIGSQRLVLTAANSYGIRFNNVILKGSPTLEVNNNTILGGNQTVLSETATGKALTKQRNGELFLIDALGLSTLNIEQGAVRLIGENGRIVPGTLSNTGVVNINGASNSVTGGLLHLDNNGSVAGTLAAANGDRLDNNVSVRMFSNALLRLTGPATGAVTEIAGSTISVLGGHAGFDVVKTGTSADLVVLQLGASGLSISGNGTVNLTGTNLGATGGNSSRIIMPGQAESAILPTNFHSGNEWARYNTSVDTNVLLGVQPFTSYTVNSAETGWQSGQQIKLNGATGVTLTAARTIDTLNLQFSAANQSVNTNGNTLLIEDGGILVATNTAGIIGASGGLGGITAGTTAAATPLHIINNAQLDLKVAPKDNGAGGAVTMVKSGTGTLRLTHDLLGVGTAAAGIGKLNAATWSAANTGGWVIQDGTLDVHRGQFLGPAGTTITLAGGTLQLNEPMPVGSDFQQVPGWGQNIVVTGNSNLVNDNNGESNDANASNNTFYKLGSLTIDGSHVLGLGGFQSLDMVVSSAAFTNTPILNLGVGRDANSNTVNAGVQSGSGFHVVAYGATPSAYILGGGPSDTSENTFNGAITLYGGTVRLNKANGTLAVPNGSETDDIVISGGTLAWGPGLVGSVNGNAFSGIGSQTTAGSGQNQIADTATVTLLTGTLGESDRFNTDKWGTLNQKNGTLNVGRGVMEVDVANISGGAFAINNGGTFKAGTLNLLPGSYSPGVTVGLPGASTGVTTLEVGAGGLAMNGQNITLGTGSSGNFAGAAAVLKLGGNLTVESDRLNANSYSQGIYIQLGNSFREIGNSRVDLGGGNRAFTVAEDVQFYITAPIINGGLVKNGGGGLVLEPYQVSSFTGSITVNAGTLSARANGAFGGSEGGVTINAGGTVKLEGGWSYHDSFTLSGPGAIVPGSASVREIGALVSESGTNRIEAGAAVTLAGAATIASNHLIVPGATPAGGANVNVASNFIVSSATGITGTGTLTLSGHGDGVITNGVNTVSGGLAKDGAGRWTLEGAGTYSGPTVISAGALRIANNMALGGITSGTTVYGGGSLELSGGITVLEPFAANGAGMDSLSGALVNVGGANTYDGAITLGSDSTFRSRAGTLSIGGSIGASDASAALTLNGAGNGILLGTLSLAGGLTKSGTGTWKMSGATTTLGNTTISGGTLLLDYTANNSSKLGAAAPLTLSGGSLVIAGSNAANTSQSVSGITLLEGGNTIRVEGGAGRTASLAIGDISRITSGTVDFIVAANASITAFNPLVNGIIGGYATSNGQDWATITGGNIAPLGLYQTLGINGISAAEDNLQVTGTQTQLDASATIAANSLKLVGGSGLGLKTNNMTLGSGGVIYSGAGNSAISGTGTLTGLTNNEDVVFHVANGSLDVAVSLNGIDSNGLVGNGGVTKAGAGTLFLRAPNTFLGPVNINSGTLAIVGPGGTVHPAVLGATGASRNINLNGGTFRVLGDFDPGASSMQVVVGSSGGAIRMSYGGTIILNDANQFQGVGDLLLTGGGRYTISQATIGYTGFGGNVTVDGGVLNLLNINAIGGRAEQVITLKPGSALINRIGSGVGVPGLPNDLVLEGGTELYVQGGNRQYSGDIQLSGTNTIALVERDAVQQDRQMFLTGRVSGSGITLNVFGSSNAAPLYLSSGSNELTGTIILNPNAALEARVPGSLGTTSGGVTIVMAANSRLLLRHYQNADFKADVVLNNHGELNSDRLVNYAGGGNQLLSIGKLTVNNSPILTFSGGNSYTTRIADTATFNGNAIVNALTNVLFEKGMNYAGGASILDKRGGGSLILRGPANQTGSTIIQGGSLLLRGSEGALSNSSSIELRGGELRVDNSDAPNANRLNDAATIVLGGGTLRVIGTESTLGAVSVQAGQTTVAYSLATESGTPEPLVLTGLTATSSRAVGATINFTSDFGTLGALSSTNARVQPRIILPNQADITGTDIIPWAVGSNNEFVQYSNTIDNGTIRGVVQMSNANYSTDPAETAFSSTVIARLQGNNVTTVLSADRSLRAIKMDGNDPGTASPNNTVRRLDLNARTLSVDRGAIMHVANVNAIGNQSATANATLTSGNSELIFTVNSGTLEIGNTSARGTSTGLPGNVIIADGAAGKVSLVKSGAGTLQLRNLNSANGLNPANTFTGDVYLNAGTLDVWRGNQLGPTDKTIQLTAGTLNLNAPDPAGSENVGLPGFGQRVRVMGNSTIALDNKGETAGSGTDNNYGMGSLTIGGPYTLAVRGVASQDISFDGAAFAGTPTIDLPQVTNGTNTSTVTIANAISGSGFYVSSTGNVANTAAVLQLGNADAIANTYSGKLVMAGGGLNNQPTLQLNKAAGTTAVTGDVEVNSGLIQWMADEQMTDAGKLTLNFGTVDFNGKSETLAGVTMRGGVIRTNSAALAEVNTIVVNGDFEATGASLLNAVADGVQINSNSTLTITGTLRMSAYGKVVLGASAATLNVGALELAGNVITQSNGAGANVIRLAGDVTTSPASIPAGIGASNDSDTFLELNGSRTFTVADGHIGLDLSLSSVIRDSTIGLPAGGIIKNGPGIMQIQGGGTANSFTGPTVVNAGSVVLFKNSNVNSLGSGALTIGDGIGGTRADQVVIRNSEQINNDADVTVASSGLLDLASFDKSEQIGSLSGSGVVTLGPGSVLTVGGSTITDFSGQILGGGALTKSGPGTLVLSGMSDYLGSTSINEGILTVSGSISGSPVLVNSSGTLAGNGQLNQVTVGSGGTLSPGNTLGKLSTRELDLQSGSLLNIQLGGTLLGLGYDQVAVAGGITLAGDLSGSLINGFVPSANDIFYLLLNDGSDLVSGNFTGLAEGSIYTFDGIDFVITYAANGDGGTVANDVALIAPIPEPTAALNLLVAGCSLLGLRRFRRSSKSRR